jgi:signal transduction histidine kinase
MLNWNDGKIRVSVPEKTRVNDVMLHKLIHVHEQSRRQRLEIETLQSQLRQERELRAVRENFTAMIAHEFGTPLSVIRAKNSLLTTYLDPISKPQIAQQFVQIETQINHMVDLIDDLVFVNRSNSTQAMSQPEPIDLVPYCMNLLNQIARRWEGHEVVFTTSSRVKTVLLDRRVVHYMLSNLLSNAFKYSPDGREIQLDIQEDGQQIIFTISDQGIGIPDGELDKIFTPLYRASNAHEFTGMGLGLAVVKTSIEGCGGSIRVESTLGEGTTFIVSLPCKKA